jgi:hypothetical protein
MVAAAVKAICKCCGGILSVIKILIPNHFHTNMARKPKGRRPLGRPRCMWVDGIEIDLREIGWDGMDWINVTQDRDHWRALLNMVMTIRCWEVLE